MAGLFVNPTAPVADVIFVDTDVLIDAATGMAAALQALQDLSDSGEELATTSINVAEFLRGVPLSKRKEAIPLLAGFAEVPFGPRAAHRFSLVMAALDRAGQRLPTVDGLVAAVALEEGGRILTRNAKHFQRVAGLEVLPVP